MMLNPYRFGGGAVDPYYASVSMLLHFEGTNTSTTITDSSPIALQWTAVGDAAISTTRSKFGNSSLRLNGAGYVRPADMAVADPYFDLGTGAWTLDMQVWLDNTSGVQTVYSRTTPKPSILLLNGNGTNGSTAIADKSGSGTAVQLYGDTKLSNTVTFFNTCSIYLDGTGDCVRIPASAANNIGLQDFTFAAWVYLQTYGNGYTNLLSAFETASGGPTQIPLLLRTDGRPWFYQDGGSGWLDSSIAIPLNTKTYFEIGSKIIGAQRWWYLFVNGQLAGSAATAATSILNRDFYVGGHKDFYHGSLRGYFDDVELLVGTCRHTTAYTVPTAAAAKGGAKLALELQGGGPALVLRNAAGVATTVANMTVTYSTAVTQLRLVGTTGNYYGSAIHPSGAFICVAVQNLNKIECYSIASDGALALVSSITVDSSPWILAFHPNGNYLYCTCNGANTINKIDFSSAGALSNKSSYAGFSGALGLGITSNGYLFVANRNANTVSMCSIDAAGVPTKLNDYATGDGNYKLCVSPDNLNVYVANYGNGSISQYQISGATLVSLGTVSGAQPDTVAIHPNGKYLYSGNDSSNVISTYSRDLTLRPTGALVKINDLLNTANNANEAIVSPDGNSLYVACWGNGLYRYSINQTTGLPTFDGQTTALGTVRNVTVSLDNKYVFISSLDSKLYEFARSFTSVNNSPLTPATWTQITARRSVSNGIGTVTLDVAGTTVATGTFSDALDFAATDVVTIGAQLVSGSASQFFTGNIDEARLTKNVARASAVQTAAWPDAAS